MKPAASVMPPLRDPRYAQAIVLCAYAIAAREVFHFERNHWVTLGCVGWSIVLDLVVGKFWYRRTVFPLSAIIIGLASSILLDARDAYPYLAAATLGILSKAFLTYRGKHFFNPGNFGVVVVLQLGAKWATGMPDLFTGTWLPSITFAAVGLAVAGYARQLDVSLSWILGFLLFALIQSVAFGAPLVLALLPCLGPSFLLFAFHMITDPATTPRHFGTRVAFGAAIALLDAGFRVAQIPYGMFYALFIVSAFLPWIRDAETVETAAPREVGKAA